MKSEINIIQAINELLFQHDRVVVPHFGTFTLLSHSASIDTERNLFKPPFKSLTFSSQERDDDGVLTSYLVNNYHLTTQESVRTIKLFISSCVADMVLGKKVCFEGIGDFCIENQVIVFKADENANFDSFSFGLTNFVMQPIDSTAEHGIGLRENRAKIRKMNIRRAIASAAAVLLLFFGFYEAINHDVQGRMANYASMLPFFYSSPNEYIVSNFDELFFDEESIETPTEEIIVEQSVPEIEETEEVEEIEVIEEIQPSDSVAQTEEQAVDDNSETEVQELVETTIEPIETAVVEPIVEKQYYVIAGSFASSENANKFEQTLEKKGFKPVTIEKNGKWRVAYAESTSKDKALQLLEKVRSEQDPNSWLIAK